MVRRRVSRDFPASGSRYFRVRRLTAKVKIKSVLSVAELADEMYWSMPKVFIFFIFRWSNSMPEISLRFSSVAPFYGIAKESLEHSSGGRSGGCSVSDHRETPGKCTAITVSLFSVEIFFFCSVDNNRRYWHFDRIFILVHYRLDVYTFSTHAGDFWTIWQFIKYNLWK